MNDKELTGFLARVNATRHGFPVDALTIAHWRDVLDPDQILPLADVLAAFVLFEQEDKSGFLRPAHIIDNIRRLKHAWLELGESVVRQMYGPTARDRERDVQREIGRQIKNPRAVEALLTAHFDGKPERMWAVEDGYGYDGDSVLTRRTTLAAILGTPSIRALEANTGPNPRPKADWMNR